MSRTALCGLLTTGALSASIFAQQDRPVFRARTDLVRIDVVAVDADGHAVHGLTRDDFEVLDRGRPQRVAAFDEISHTRAAEPALPATLKRDVADNTKSSADRLIILVLDDLHFQAKTGEVKAMARSVVADIGPGASLALVTTSGVFGVEPTVDRAVLLSELDRFLDKFDPEMRRLVRGARMPNPSPIRNALGERVSERGPSNLGRFFGDMATYKTVEDVTKRIGIDPGRRNALVWIGGGMNAPRAAQCDAGPANKFYCGALAGLLESLRKSNVAAYAIATRDFSSELLKDVADASGGFVMNAATFDRDLPRLIDDLDHYYLIGFYPDDVSDRKFHPIEVRVRRPGLTVRYRRGYQPSETPKPRNAGVLARMSEGVLPIADLPLRLAATPLAGAGKDSPRSVIVLEIHAPRASLAEVDGHLRDVLRYEVWAIDMRKKKVVKSVAREARLDLDPAEAAAAAGDPLPYQVQTALALKPGRYQLRASARSVKVGKGGSVFHEIEVPDFTHAPAVGAIVLGYASGARVPIVRGGLGVALLPVAPTLDREFLRTDLLRVVCAVGTGAVSGAGVRLDLLRGSGAQVRRIASGRPGSDGTPAIDTTLSLDDLTPGAYRLRVTLIDGAVTTQREAGFVVR
jgi:VWFA-related protein